MELIGNISDKNNNLLSLENWEKSVKNLNGNEIIEINKNIIQKMEEVLGKIEILERFQRVNAENILEIFETLKDIFQTGKDEKTMKKEYFKYRESFFYPDFETAKKMSREKIHFSQNYNKWFAKNNKNNSNRTKTFQLRREYEILQKKKNILSKLLPSNKRSQNNQTGRNCGVFGKEMYTLSRLKH